MLVLANSVAWGADEDLSTRSLAGGRTYQVLAGPGAKEEANRPLVLYLSSPAGPNLEAFRKDYWPGLKERTCVVVIPLARSEKMWLAEDGNYVERVLADARAAYRTDPRRIILLGVSGGGQMALFFADHEPEMFRAVIAVSANPVMIRGSKAEWFYPAERSLKKCPYFVVNHITEGSALLYWRQVRERLAPRGASITVWPVVGEGADHYLPPPKELWPWLDEVLAGRQPAPLEDPQKAAVAKMFERPAAALAGELEKAAPVPWSAARSEATTETTRGAPTATPQAISKEAAGFSLRVPVPADFERSPREDAFDAAGRPLAQVRLEHARDAIYVRCEARAAESPMKDVLAEEANQTLLRGMLYQVYATGRSSAAGGGWEYQIASITFPHKDRGWQSTLFFHARTATSADGRKWLEVTVLDETQQPDAKQLAGAIRTLLGGLDMRPAQPKTGPAK